VVAENSLENAVTKQIAAKKGATFALGRTERIGQHSRTASPIRGQRAQQYQEIPDIRRLGAISLILPFQYSTYFW
jgi:hypothetical protein